MANEIAVQGMTLGIVDSTPTLVIGTINITGTPSIINKSGGNGIYLDNLAIQITNITSPAGGATIPDPGPKNSNILATAQKVKETGIAVLRTGDKTGIISAIPKIPGSPAVDYPVTFKVEILNAGQIKARAL